MRWPGLVVAVLAAACSKGSGAPAPVDAGFDAGAAERQRHSIEFRTALIAAYPEYRDTAVLDVTARVTRVIPGLTPAQRNQALRQLNYEKADDGGWELNAFHLSQPAPDTLSVAVSYDADRLSHLYITPTGLNSMELSMYLPRELPVGSERFTFDVHYASAPWRCRELVRQAVMLLLSNGQWVVDGFMPQWTDAGEVVAPDEETLVLLGADGATLTFHRTRGQVRVQYALQTID